MKKLLAFITITIPLFLGSIIEDIKQFFHVERCKKCASKKLEPGYWSRSWDTVHGGAGGCRGTRCFDCGNIVWDKSLEEYKATLPSHYKAFNN